MEFLCRVTSMGLAPMYDSDLDEKKRLKIGETVLCKITKPRNYEFHKKFFALVRLTFDNLPEWIVRDHNVYSLEDMLTLIKLDLGFASLVQHGEYTLVKEKSISFAKMDNTEFEKFYNRAVDIVLYKYLRGTEKESLLEEIYRFK
jgi:hypothetical protein